MPSGGEPNIELREAVVRLREEGLSYTAIGRMLGITKNAAVGHGRRGGAPIGASIIGANRRPNPKPPRRPKDTLPPLPALPPPPPPREPPMIVPSPQQIPLPVVIPFPEPAPPPASCCQWFPMDHAPWKPCGRPAYRRPTLCEGDLVLVPTSWCREHYLRVYRTREVADAAD